MAPPIKKKMMSAMASTTPTTPPLDLSEEKPVVGTMNYARKFPDGATGGYAAPGMAMIGKKKVMKYADGAKRIKAGSEQEKAAPSVASTEDDTAIDPIIPMQTPVAPDYTPTTAMDLPASRNAGKKTPADYKEAAAVIKGDKALYSQYKAGIASGKTFSLSVGGKTFKYAATPKTAPATKDPTLGNGPRERAAIKDYGTAIDEWDGRGSSGEWQDNMPNGPTRAAKVGQATEAWDKAIVADSKAKKMKSKK